MNKHVLYISTVHSYPFKLLVDPRGQHDAGHHGAQQQDEGVDDPGHRGVPGAGTAAAQQTGGAAAQARQLDTHTITSSSACESRSTNTGHTFR